MQSLVGLTQLLERRFEECLVLVSLAGAQGCQSVQANINTYCCFSGVCSSIRDFDGNTDEPPICRARHTCSCHLAFEAQVLCHIHPAELGNPDAMIAQLELIVGKVKACFASLLAFELGTALLSFKERRKRLSQVKKRLVRGILGDFPRPGKLVPPDLVELLFQLESCWFLARFILAIPLSQCPIPHKPCSSCS